MDFLDNSRKCAGYLQGLGIKKGDYISIFSSNRVESAYLMLGVIGSGAVLTPCKEYYRERNMHEISTIDLYRYIQNLFVVP